MSVLVAAPTPVPSPSLDHTIPRKRTSSFSFPLRPAKAPRLGLSHHRTIPAMGATASLATLNGQALRRTETFASLSELLLEAVSTPVPAPSLASKFSPQLVVSPTPQPKAAPSPSPSKQQPSKEVKEIPYTRTLQYQQDQRLARRRKPHSPARCDSLADLSVPVAAQLVKEPPPAAPVLTPAPQPKHRRSPKEKERRDALRQQRQPDPHGLSFKIRAVAPPPSPSPLTRRKSPPRAPQVILPSPTSPHAVPIVLTHRTTSPLRPAGPAFAPGRPVFPRSKRDVSLFRIACMKRLEGGEGGNKGRQMRSMGVRGAVEVWRATRELESMVCGEGDEMDVDAEGDTDEECDPFEADDGDLLMESLLKKVEPVVKLPQAVSVKQEERKVVAPGKGKALERQGSLILSNSWVVVPGEDWEMVDCAP